MFRSQDIQIQNIAFLNISFEPQLIKSPNMVNW